MSDFIAALPMYDWPEVRGEVDADWAAIRDRLRAQGVEAPEGLTRRNGDMPAVPGGIRDREGRVIAPDPATLPPDELDVQTLWRHPKLLFAQTCWGPMELGLQEHVRVVAQPDYTAFDGGQGELYSSAVLMRGGEAAGREPPDNGEAVLSLEAMRGARLAYNSQDSMSGLIALTRDLDAVGQSLALFGERVETGSHRASAVAVAEGRADVCAVDCRSWHLIGRFEPKAADLVVAGWTARRKGLPYVCSRLAPTFKLAIGTGG
ncbi:phosphate/phosphite/phosphonate ABC transporter substrate-binding protein [Aquibium oceanicum]|uniref:Phosphate ABC transporter substrate-binding protein n=1 Tax=Aquibium oceanicum TaxID=1670800 RepID=A0A1L3STE9_9HYPH|nr:PhnD/SsuA/transferrin family substrate-binding protein [Aquibium oceanicum]APH72605.1 phosphate ABC transporter substrate-binding protein [Aquibium oceanicum]